MITPAAKPLRRHRAPAYPTKLDVDLDPHLLAENLPPSWQGAKDLARTAAVFAAASVGGCSEPPSAQHPGNGTPAQAIVAPIFEHGEGRGAVGCVVVSPPVFLSEEDALQVIHEELARAGLEPTVRDTELWSVVIPKRQQELRVDWISGRWDMSSSIVEVAGTGRPLEVDLLDPERAVAVEYVSTSDHERMWIRTFRSTVRGFDLKEAAQWLSEKTQGQEEAVHLGVLYDPASRVRFRWSRDDGSSDNDPQAFKTAEEARAGSQRLLRQQVRDFVDWLKGQGVI
jgi:hypothetical protein